MSKQASAWGFKVSRSQAALLAEFSVLLNSYTETNIIGARNLNEVIEDHVLDSLSCLLFEPLKRQRKLVDVGSGGGLPGIPLSLVLENSQVSLVEATNKKARFLQEAIETLGVPNAWVSNTRVEEFGKSKAFRERFDIATARAVASLDILAEYCLPLVKVGGYVVAMKGHLQEEELEKGQVAAKALGAEISDIIPVLRIAEHTQKQRQLVILTKTTHTSAKYPRRIGLPSKKPLGIIGNL